MEIFKSVSLFEFQEMFSDDLSCKKYLYHFKWKNGFTCLNCGHTKSWVNTAESGKVCKECGKIHSTMSNTIFHGVRFSLRKAFFILFEMTSSTKSMSSLQIARRYSVNRKTAWLIMRKFRSALKSSNDYPIKNDNSDIGGTDSVVYVDEFEVGGYEKGMVGKNSKSKKRKMLMVVEATTKNKIKRVYGLKIKGHSGDELSKIFKSHIAKGTKVIVDGWSAYNLMNNNYCIIHDKQGMKKANNPMNRMIQQFKSWVRGIYHKSSHAHIESYLNAFCFRINRSQWKETHFHSAMLKAIQHPLLTKKMIPNAHDFV